MTVHGFDEQLKFSHSLADAPWWDEVYRTAFPDMVSSLDLRHDGWHQRAGRDRVITLSSGRQIFIDEKGRTEAWDDILVEVWSRYPKAGREPYPQVRGAVPGWAVEPKDCDFLAYALVPSRTCYLFPFLGIRAAWAKHGGMWRGKATCREGGFQWKAARNATYNTINITVPTRILHDCINDALTVSWAR